MLSKVRLVEVKVIISAGIEPYRIRASYGSRNKFFFSKNLKQIRRVLRGQRIDVKIFVITYFFEDVKKWYVISLILIDLLALEWITHVLVVN